ncbi:glutaminase A, partial [Bacillus licheniformis]|uniref:glutaminase n=1 Tax=Bacillus licheniformis TaxID=1402 RepID=UPI000F96C697
GAIVATSLLVEKYGRETFRYILQRAGELLGNPSLEVSEVIFESERSSAFANRALTYMLLNDSIISKTMDVEELLGVYFHSCSILVNTSELSELGFLLARGGVDLSGKRHMSEEHAKILRTVM